MLSAAVRETKTCSEWKDLLETKSILAYSDLDSSPSEQNSQMLETQKHATNEPPILAKSDFAYANENASIDSSITKMEKSLVF